MPTNWASGVDQHQHAERAGLAALGPAQLADHEREDARRRRPVTQPVGVGQRLRRPAAGEPPRRPGDRAADRAPRAQQPEHVAQQQRGERHADPEADVDRRRGEVVLLGVGAGEAGVGGDRERRHAERAEHDLDREPAAAPAAAPGPARAAGATSRPRAPGTRPRARPPPRRRTAASGIGRSARPTIPWATISTRPESMNDGGPARERGRRMLQRVCAGLLRALRRGVGGHRLRLRRDRVGLEADHGPERELLALGAARRACRARSCRPSSRASS